jgi:hypothetical protein
MVLDSNQKVYNVTKTVISSYTIKNLKKGNNTYMLPIRYAISASSGYSICVTQSNQSFLEFDTFQSDGSLTSDLMLVNNDFVQRILPDYDVKFSIQALVDYYSFKNAIVLNKTWTKPCGPNQQYNIQVKTANSDGPIENYRSFNVSGSKSFTYMAL